MHIYMREREIDWPDKDRINALLESDGNNKVRTSYFNEIVRYLNGNMVVKVEREFQGVLLGI